MLCFSSYCYLCSNSLIQSFAHLTYCWFLLVYSLFQILYSSFLTVFKMVSMSFLMLTSSLFTFLLSSSILPPKFLSIIITIILFYFILFLILILYYYSITVVCLFSPSFHPTPAEPPSLPLLHPSLWFCPCVLYSSSCNPLSSLSPPHSHLTIVRLFLTSMSWLYFVSFFSSIYYVPVKGEIIWYLSLTVWLISLNLTIILNSASGILVLPFHLIPLLRISLILSFGK